MTTITLRDLDSRDDDGAPYEFTGTEQKIASYLDGPLRRDLDEAVIDELDEAIAHVRASELVDAATILNRFAVVLIVDGEPLARTT